ncbi:MAG: hydantoinase/oxoprolinase family protein [Rhodospirillales bacterium]|nr:hydantoinase/oxoprolinase family protein [Rhodospirillales bacterium]MDE0377795.1 hydantoinase/oxoprolinase family protein [Rhodospirillales bacterium]
MTNLRVAVDIGGTFTDICILDEDSGALRVAKTASTPDDPLVGAMRGLEEAKVDLKDVTLFSHGTTVATNALITRRLPPAAMICTEGYRDVIEIRRSNKEDLWDTYKDVAQPYIRRRDRLTVRERIDHGGRVATPLDEADAREKARILRKRGVEAVAVCFMNSFINPQHEARMKEILVEELPGVEITTSSETLPEIFEHERFSTTVVNAILSPVVGGYVKRMNDALQKGGYASDLLMLHSGGGVMTPATAGQFAGRLAGSGIAAGAIASRHIAMLCGYENSIGLDMGGTSCDVSLVFGGESRVTKDWHIEFGYPIRFPSIEVLTIGAGGGSLAWIDDAGSLHNGPQSAGADPGPACYGRGNTTPTNTDANLALGRLGTQLAGGQIMLDKAASEAAVRTGVAEPLGMDSVTAAKAIVSVANANMADAVRLISISRGYDPRDFALVAFGGAGALHGVALAKELSIPTVIVPPNPGVTSALGCLLVDVRHDLSQTYLALAADADPADIEARFAEMEAEAKSRLVKEGVADADMVLQRSIDMMYQGQWRSLQVPVASPFTSVPDAVNAFHADHDREYAFRRDDTPVELFRLNLAAIGTVPKAELMRHAANGAKAVADESRMVDFDEVEGAVETPIYSHEGLPAGVTIEGPAIIEQLDSTTVIPPGVRAEVDEWLNIRIHVAEA